MLIKEAQNLNFAMPVELIKDKISSKMVTAISESGLEDYEKTADYWFNLGYYHHQSAMYKEAIEAYKQALRIDPDNAMSHYYLGDAYVLLNDSGSALGQYKILKSLDPEWANKLFNIIYNNKNKNQLKRVILLLYLQPKILMYIIGEIVLGLMRQKIW